MTLTLLWFPAEEESIFLSDRTAGMDGLSSRPPLDASSCEEVEKVFFENALLSDLWELF